MNLKLIRWRLPLSYAAIALITALLLGLILLFVLQQHYRGQEIEYLKQNASGIGLLISSAQESEMAPGVIQELVETFALFSHTQVRLLSSQGQVLIDTGEPYSRSDFIFNVNEERDSSTFDGEGRVAIYPLLRGRDSIDEEDMGRLARLSEIMVSYQFDPIQGLWISVPGAGSRVGAFPVLSVERSDQVVTQPYFDKNNGLAGYVELSKGPAYGREILKNVAWGWALAGLLAVVLAGVGGWFVSRRFTGPLASLNRVTTSMAAGDLSGRADISRQDEFGRLAVSFNAMASQVERQFTALRRFVADAAHGIHTPLTALRTNLDLVSAESQVENESPLDHSFDQLVRLERISSNLLTLSRLESTSSMVQVQKVNLKEILEEQAEVYASMAEQAGVDFSILAPEDTFIDGIRDDLGILIGNLLDNAVKFTPKEGQVSVTLEKDAEYVLLRVEDTGIGVPEEDRQTLFQRFQRGRNASAYPGSGLGLAIVKAVAEAHQGTVAVISQELGTTFEVKLPLNE